VTDTKKRMAGSRLIALWLISLALMAGACTAALAQGTDTVYDEAGVLTESQEQNVQEAFDSAQEESGQPIYAFLVPDTGVSSTQDRRDLLTQEAREANAPQDAGAIMVAPKDRWDVAANLNGVSEDAVSNAMEPGFRNGNFAAGLIAGADEIKGGPVAPSSSPEGGAGLLLGGGLLVLLAGAAALILFRNRRARRRRIEQERGRAEEEFAGLTTRLEEFGEKEQLVSGYLEAQRPLLDQKTEEWVGVRISDANTAGFAQEFNEAASVLTSDPFRARELMGRGRDLLAGAIENLNEAERTMDAYRAADEALDDRLLAAEEGIQTAERAGKVARSEGVAVEPPKLRPDYDRLTRRIGDRASHRDEFDPRETLAALEEIYRQAREYDEAVRDNISARDALPDERHATEGTLVRARTALEDYRGAYERAVGEFGRAALGEAPDPGELSSGLLESDGAMERADRASSAGRFVEASSLLGRAADLAGETMRAPGRLKAATVEADRKKREGEEKLQELEARLAQAKANEHLMGPHQRQRLREYEYQLQNARYGFFGGDWLTAILLFEALDNDYMYMGDPSSFDDTGGDWGGGDFGGGDWGGGDWGGGDFGGGDF
jgi:uncharacterized membrane protein YgcG